MEFPLDRSGLDLCPPHPYNIDPALHHPRDRSVPGDAVRGADDLRDDQRRWTRGHLHDLPWLPVVAWDRPFASGRAVPVRLRMPEGGRWWLRRQ